MPNGQGETLSFPASYLVTSADSKAGRINVSRVVTDTNKYFRCTYDVLHTSKPSEFNLLISSSSLSRVTLNFLFRPANIYIYIYIHIHKFQLRTHEQKIGTCNLASRHLQQCFQQRLHLPVPNVTSCHLLFLFLSFDYED